MISSAAVLLPLLLAFAKTDEAFAVTEDNHVLVLNNDNFDKAVEDNQHILVEFYAPWCGHCKALAPEYEKAAQSLNSTDSKIKLGKVDATVEKELASKFGVNSYPTIKFFKAGEAKEYNGPREAKGIVVWLEKRVGSPAKVMTTVDEVKAAAEENKAMALGLFKDKESEQAKEFLKAAEENDNQPFIISHEQAVFDNFEVTEDNAVIMLTQFDEEKVKYDGEFKAEAMNKFVRATAIPLISEFTEETTTTIFGSDIKVHFVLLAGKEEQEKLDSMLEALRPLAKENKGKLVFVHVNSAKEDNARILDFFGVDQKDCPKFLLFEMDKGAKYVSEDDPTSDKMSAFIANYFEGKLKRTLKSEKLPEDWDSKPVKVLANSNFDQVAMDKEKFVFVKFYAPWCGHCKAMAPTWDELGEHFKDSDKVIIAKMDATANELEDLTITSFPTLKLFKKETNEAVDYDGGRQLETMIRFVAEHTGDAAEKTDQTKDEL